MQLPAITGSWT